jgi:periplasmic divalent cation tolerance protein
MTSDTQSGTTDSPASGIVLVLTTLPVTADAEALAATLVEERLAACVTIGGPMTSVYTWQGSVERAQERQLLLKTVQAKVPLIKARLLTLHPYEVPELLVLPVDGGAEAYLAWVRDSTTG